MKYLSSMMVLLWGACIVQAQESCYVNQPYVDTYLYTQEDFGQSFMPCSTAELYRLDIPVHNLQVGSFEAVLSIYIGDGYGGELIYSHTVTIGDEWGSYLIHDLPSPLGMNAGQTYTYRIDFNGNYGTMWANFANIYTDGQQYWNGTVQPTIDMGFLAHMYLIDDPCVTWIGGQSASWDEPLNWSSGLVPDSMDCVIIPDGISFDPVIPVKAEVNDLTIMEQGHLHLPTQAELTIYHTFDQRGSSDLQGTVLMKQGETGGEILGSPLFNTLRLQGFYMLSEPVTVLDLLDVESGFLANVGSTLTLKVDSENSGHIYMPAQNIAGPVTFEKDAPSYYGELVGVPFTDLSPQDLVSENADASVACYNAWETIIDPEDLWSDIPAADSTFNPAEALLLNSSEETIHVTGQASNATVHVVHMEGSPEIHDLRPVGNPFPSIVEIQAMERSPGVPMATYRWNPDEKQYSAQVDRASVHSMPMIMRPLDVILVHIPEGEQVVLDYQEAVLKPFEIDQAFEIEELEDHHIRIRVESPSGSDETLIRFKEGAAWDWDLRMDAMKIASMDALMPTLGTVSNSAKVLAINSIPLQVQGHHLPMYVDPGVEGPVQISAPMIDGGPCFSTLHLEDRKLEYFHDLLSNGAYATEVLLSDERNRFVLHFDRSAEGDDVNDPVEDFETEELNPIYPIGIENPYTSGQDYDIQIFSGQLVIRPGESVSEIPQEALITVYSVQGKLVFQRRLTSSTNRFNYQLNVSPGIYHVEVATGSQRQRKKVWID